MKTRYCVLFLADILRETQTPMPPELRPQETHNITPVQSLYHIRLRKNVVAFEPLRHMGLRGYDDMRSYKYTVGPSPTSYGELSAGGDPGSKIG